MINRNEFNQNFQYFDKEIVIEIIDIFINEFEERFRNLKDDVSVHNFDKLKFDAHSLKGVIANFMDPDTIELAKRLDEMAKNKVTNGLEDTLVSLEVKSRVLLSELIKIKAELT